MGVRTISEKVYEITKQYSGTPFRDYTTNIFNDHGGLRICTPSVLLKILKDPTIIETVRTKAQTKLNNTVWDKPRIVSILDLKTETKEQPKAFDYQTEVRQMTKYLLKQNNGTLCESPKKVWRRIQEAKSNKETWDILTDVLKPSADRERERLSLLKDLDGFPTDGFLIAKYLSTDNKAIAKVWDRDPKKDMGKGNEFHCCTLPFHGSDYLTDPNISMLDFFGGGERYARAILVACKDEKDKVLVVDSIEGSRRFMDNHDGKKDSICRFMADSIQQHANETGFNFVVYNANVFNRWHIYQQIFNRIPIDEERQFLRTFFRRKFVNRGSYLESFYSGITSKGYIIEGKKIKTGDLDEN
jgi:hypothetical protein